MSYAGPVAVGPPGPAAVVPHGVPVSRPRGDLGLALEQRQVSRGRGGGTAAAAVGRSLIAYTATSRPQSCDSPKVHSVSPALPVGGSPLQRTVSDPEGPAAAQRLERERGRRPQMPNLNGIDCWSPDSLSELLGLHSRPQSDCTGARGNGGNGLPSVFPPSPLSAGLPPSRRWGPNGRPSSRDDREGESAGGTRPPRAPHLQGSGASTSSVSANVGPVPSSSSVGNSPARAQRSRPPSRPRSRPPEQQVPVPSAGTACSPPPRRGAPAVVIHAPAAGGLPGSSGPSGASGSSGNAAVQPPLTSQVATTVATTAIPVVANPVPQSHQADPLCKSTVPPWGARSAAQIAALVSLAQDPNAQFRPYMEDGHRIVDPLPLRGRDASECWGFFAVYDGHGGRTEVDYCEAKLHEVVLAELRSQTSNGDARAALSSAFEKVDGQLAMLGAWNSGCTATVALAHRQGSATTFHIANVGDSRAVLVCDTGVRRVSTDHRACDPSEARRITEEGGFVRHGRVGGQLSVSRSLGDHHLKGSGVSCVPDVCTCNAGEGEVLVIASDGLWDALEDDDVRQVLRSCVENAVTQRVDIGSHMRDGAARALVNCAKERGSRDNILALAVFV